MKKNICFNVIAAALMGASFVGCSDFLEPDYRTNDGKTADMQFSSDPQSLLNAAMMNLRTIVDQTYLYASGTDLYTNQQDAHGDDPYAKYTLTPSQSEVESFYKVAYKTINYANGAIRYSDETGEIGMQARFVRNYCYYLLTQQFGGVPYLTKYIESAETSYPRVALDELYPDMIADLEDLALNLPAANPHNGKASKQAAYALLAKVYLAAGWDLDTKLVSAAEGTYSVTATGSFSKAAEAAKNAIAGIALTMSNEEKWAPENEGNEEEIFSVQYNRGAQASVGTTTKSGNSMQNAYCGYWQTPNTWGYKQGNHYHVQSPKSVYLFEKGDKRFEATFMTTFYGFEEDKWGSTGYYAYYNASPVEKASLHIGHRFFPYYVTESEAQKEFTDKKDLYAQGNCLHTAYACILGSTTVGDPKAIKYTFKPDGSYSKESKTYDVHTGYGSLVNEGMAVKKWDDPATEQVDNNSNCYRDIVVLHVSDMYLIEAEALLMAGKESEALALVNAVRARAEAPAVDFASYNPAYKQYCYTTFAPTKLDVILDERARELYAENQRWMDLRRTKQLVRYNIAFNEYISSVSDMSNAEGEVKWYRPIPTTEIQANTGMSEEDQNPGY